jgi:hypothetical protein
VQTEDAKRAGIKFTERYLFNEEKSTNIDVDDKEPSNIKENRLSTFVPVIENSEYSEELKNIIIKDKSEIVSDLLEKGSPLAKQLIKILKPSLSENLKIKRNPNVLSGTYNSNSNIIELNPNIEDLENTLLHELIHDATVSTIFLVKNTPEKTTNAQIKAVENLEKSI